MVFVSRTIDVSVIMPIYQTKKEYLEKAILSVLNQSFQNFEFIILNDSPYDKRIKKIIEKFKDERIRYLENDTNIGIAKSYNKLLEQSKGKYIALMNHDDEMLSYRLEKQFNFLEANSDVGLVGSGYKKFGELNRFKNIYGPKNHEEIMAMFLFKSPIHHPTIMMRRDIIKKYNIRYNEEFISLNDRQFCWEFGKYAKLYNIDEVLYKYRFHPDMTSKIEKFKIRKEKAVFHKLWFLYYGIALNEKEVFVLDNYVTIGRAKIKDKKTIKDVVSVLEKLAYVNKVKKIISEDIFNEICGKYVQKRCLNAIFRSFINVKDVVNSSILPMKKKTKILLLNSVLGWRN